MYDVDSIMVGMDSLRRIKYTDEDHVGPTWGGATVVSVATWVEGIGSDGGLFGIYNSLPEILTTTNADFYQFTYGKWGEMDSCYENSKYVFTNDNYHKNGITEGFVGIVFVRNVEREVYDLQGPRVLTPQLSGLYIQGGKKFIFR